MSDALRKALNIIMAPGFGDKSMSERKAFEAWVKESGSFTDWTRHGDGYAKPLVNRTWKAWQAAVAWARADGEEGNDNA